MDNSKSWRSSFYQASRPVSVINDNDVEFSLVLAEISVRKRRRFHTQPVVGFLSRTITRKVWVVGLVVVKDLRVALYVIVKEAIQLYDFI